MYTLTNDVAPSYHINFEVLSLALDEVLFQNDLASSSLRCRFEAIEYATSTKLAQIETLA